MAQNIGTNPYLPPDIQLQQINLQRQQALADALRQQSLESTPSEVVSGRVVPKGILGAIAPLLRAGLANKTQDNVSQGQIGLTKAYSDYLTNSANSALPGNSQPAPQPQAPTGMTQDGQTVPTSSAPSGQAIGDAGGMSVPVSPNAAPAQPSPQPSGPQISPQLRQAYIGLLRMGNTDGANKLLEMAWQTQMPTDAAKDVAAAYGNGPDANAAYRAKVNPPLSMRQGNTMIDPVTHQPIFTSPDMDSGAMIKWNNGQPSAVQIPGMTAIQGDLARAKAGGAASYQIAPQTYGNNNQPLPAQTVKEMVDGNGQPLSTTDQAAVAAFNQAGRPADAPFAVAPNQAGKVSPVAPPGRGSLVPQLGAATGQEAAQKTLDTRFSALQDQNTNAQTVISNLENIKQQALKAATGPFSDKKDFVNGLISTFVPGEQARATDAVTANDLLDKYSNQIVAKLGQGGMGTDAARSIIQSAYPNAHMTPQAISDAAENLKGSQQLIQAKTALLSPHGNARDPIAYQQKEQVFDQNADPRLFQLRNMDAASAQAYLSKLPPQVQADLRAKAQALKGLGIF